ncbi:MAG TPA: WD40 repeat domain-containing protein, partial [Isosphaeraceae bacterium]|nr:WD40 repeat domain-containing protein [Isosphaeraceae bacterium]
NVLAACFSPDGRSIAVGGADGSARLWDVVAGPSTEVVLRVGGEVRSLAFSPSGQTIATGDQSGFVRLWDSATGRPMGPPRKDQGPVTQLAFDSAGSRLLAVHERGSAMVRDAATGELIGPPLSHNVWTAAFSPDGRLILTGSHNKTAQLWDVATGQPVGPSLSHDSAVLSVAFSPDGQWLLTGSADKTARLWDTATCQPIGPSLVHDGAVRAVSFRPDGRGFLTASRVARLWEVPKSTDGDLDQIALWARSLTALELDPDGRMSVLDVSAARQALQDMGGAPLSRIDWHDRVANHYEHGSRPIVALGHLDRLIEAQPENASFYARRSRLLSRLDRKKESRVDEERFVGLASTTSVLSYRISRALDASSVQDWNEVVRQLDAVIAVRPKDKHLRLLRGDALARVGSWKRASEDFSLATDESSIDDRTRYRHHLLQLVSNDLDGYRTSCEARLRRLGPSPSYKLANSVAWACIVGPDALADREIPVRLAETTVASVPGTEVHGYLNTLGAALYRASRYEEAVNRIQEGINRGGGIVFPEDLVFLALANHRLGRQEAARCSRKDLDAYRPPIGPDRFWANLELGLFRKEVEAAVPLTIPDLPSNVFAPPVQSVMPPK